MRKTESPGKTCKAQKLEKPAELEEHGNVAQNTIACKIETRTV